MDQDLVKKLVIAAGAGLIAIAGIYYMTRTVESVEKEVEKSVSKAPPKANAANKAPVGVRQNPASNRVTADTLNSQFGAPPQAKPAPGLEMQNGILTKPALIQFFEHLRTSLIEQFKKATTDFMEERQKCGEDDLPGYKAAVSKYMAVQN
jgi:hypothetical protein